MPKNHLLVLLAISGLPLLAQSDFLLFQPDVQYLYEDLSFLPEDQVYASQFYGVRLSQDKCQDLYASLDFFGSQSRCIASVPSPFGYAVCQRGDSTIMDFAELGSMVLYPRAPLDSVWTAYRVGESPVQAAVTAAGRESFLGVTDSVRTIQFFTGTGDTLNAAKISQRYGLIAGTFFYRLHDDPAPLVLAGTSRESLGRQLPPEEVYGTFATGDQFHLEEITPQRYLTADQTQLFDTHRQSTHTVVSIDSVGGGVTYFTTRGDLLEYIVPSDGSAPPRDSTIVRDTLRRLSALTTLSPSGVQPGARAIVQETGDQREYRVRSLFEGPCDLLGTRFTFEARFSDADPLCGTNDEDVDGSSPGSALTPYVPFAIDTLLNQRYPVQQFLRFAATDNLDCGTPYDFSDLVIGISTIDPALDSAVRVFPNPAGAGTVTVTVRLPASIGPVTVEVYDVTGRQLQRRPEVREQTDLSVASLRAGSYVVVVSSAGRPVARRKLLIY